MKGVVKFEGKNLILSELATFVIILFPPIAGLLYVAGSVVYWPSLNNVNPNAGGILFIVGSAMLMITDICNAYIQQQFSFLYPLRNIGTFRALCLFLGNISYTIGSIYFLPNFALIVGLDLFILGSVFLFIPQVLSVWGVCSLNYFTAPYYAKMIKFKGTIVYMNISLFFGCLLFFLGSFLFENQNTQSPGLYQEGVLMYVIGSFFFFLGPVIALRMRKIRIFDPLSKYHDQIHGHFLSKKMNILEYLTLRSSFKSEDQSIILPLEPSIIKQ